jgi:hypothetical protein
LIFLSYSLQYSYLVLCGSCFNDNIVWRGFILVMSFSCPGGFLYPNRHMFLKTWEIFCFILLTILHIPLAGTSSPSLTPRSHRFGLLMDSQSSCAFLLQFLSLLSKNSSVFFFNIYLSLSPGILSSTCSSLLEWLLTVFFI